MSNRHTPGCGCCTCEFFSAPDFGNFDFEDTVDAEVVADVLEIFALKSVTSNGIPNTSEYQEYTGDFWPETSELDFQLGTPSTSVISVSLDSAALNVHWLGCSFFYKQPAGPTPAACNTNESIVSSAIAGVRLRLVRARNTIILSGAPNNTAMQLFVTPLAADGSALHTSSKFLKRLATIGDNVLTITNTHATEKLKVAAFYAGGDTGPHEQGGGGVDPEPGPTAGDCREVITNHTVCHCNCVFVRNKTQIRVEVTGFLSSYSYVTSAGQTLVTSGWDSLNGTYVRQLVIESNPFAPNASCCGTTYLDFYGSSPTTNGVYDHFIYVDTPNIAITLDGASVPLTGGLVPMIEIRAKNRFTPPVYPLNTAAFWLVPTAIYGFMSFIGSTPFVADQTGAGRTYRLREPIRNTRRFLCDGTASVVTGFIPSFTAGLSTVDIQVFIE